MLSVEDALQRILSQPVSMPEELVPLAESHGRILARDISAPADVPPWNNSAMDGYAVRAADTSESGASLRLLEVIGAGRAPVHEVVPGTASGIMTGAPMPPGADAVVMVERTDGSRTGVVRIDGMAEVGQHVRPRGGDIAEGSVVLRAGCTLLPGRVGLVASVGAAEVWVRRRPRVAILTTGDEVIPPGRPLAPGQIYSSNNAVLVGLALQAGAIPVDRGIATDDLEGLVAALEGCLDCDAVVTTGGVSVGAYDFVKEAYARVGADVDFWKVRMKPGKPLAFGWVSRGDRQVPLFGLPGNPVSCMVNFLQFTRPWIRTALGDPAPFLPVVAATAAEDFRDRPGRARLIRVVLEQDDGGGLACRSTGSQSSGVLTSMARAHGLLLVGPEAEAPSAGASVRVQLLDPGFLDGPAPGYGW